MDFIMTNTDSVEGYVITDYVGCASAAASYLPGGVIGEGYLDSRQKLMFSNAYGDALARMRSEWKEKADAIVGIRASVCSMNGSMAYILVSVCGTAVRLEKILEPLPVTESRRRKAEEERLRAEERERAAKCRQQLDDQRRQRTESGDVQTVDPAGLISVLKSLDNPVDMMKEVEKAMDTDPTLFPEDFADKLRKNIEMSRIYSKRVGAGNFIKQVEQFFL